MASDLAAQTTQVKEDDLPQRLASFHFMEDEDILRTIEGLPCGERLQFIRAGVVKSIDTTHINFRLRRNARAIFAAYHAEFNPDPA